MCIQERHCWYYPIWKSLKSHINVTKAKIFYRYMEKNVALDSTLVEPSWEIHNQVQSFPILCNCFTNKSQVLVVFLPHDDFEPLREVLSVLFSNLVNPVWVLLLVMFLISEFKSCFVLGQINSFLMTNWDTRWGICLVMGYSC